MIAAIPLRMLTMRCAADNVIGAVTMLAVFVPFVGMLLSGFLVRDPLLWWLFYCWLRPTWVSTFYRRVSVVQVSELEKVLQGVFCRAVHGCLVRRDSNWRCHRQ
jgi:hypothetical protein